MNVLLIGSYDKLNLGDDLLLDYLIKRIVELIPNCKLHIYSENYEFRKKQYPKVVFGTKNIDLEIYDVFIWGGGTQFFDFQGDFLRSILRYVKFQLNLNKSIHSLALSQLKKGKQGIALGVGIGPFKNHSFNELIWKVLFKSINEVYLRDTLSEHFAKKWKISYSLIPDLVYGIYKQVPKHSLILKSKPKIGIIIRVWNWGKEKNYVLSMIESYRYLNIDFNVSFIIFSKIYDKKLLITLNDLNFKHHVWDPEQNSFDDFFHELNSFDIIISSRFHGIVLASMMGIPSIGIEIDPKIAMIQKELSMEKFIISFPYDPKLIKLSIFEILNNYTEISNNLLTISKRNNQFINEMTLNIKTED